MKILLITDSQLGMVSGLLQEDRLAEQIYNWSKSSNKDECTKKEASNIKKFVQISNSINPDLVIHCGDVVNDIQDKDSIFKFRKIISKLENNVKMLIAPGNHDVGENPVLISRSGLDIYKSVFGNSYHSYDINKYRLIFINSSLFMNPDELKNIYNSQLEFIDKSIKNLPVDMKVIVFTHHPPYLDSKDTILDVAFSKNISSKDIDQELSYWMFPENSRNTFFDIFSKYNCKIECIFTGHLHTNIETSYKGTKIITTSALGLPLGDHPSGYRIIDLGHTMKQAFFEI
tara:strand:- start:35 stop:895 length:861 start_codon:yes stop_codon:yes gene_type:complete